MRQVSVIVIKGEVDNGISSLCRFLVGILHRVREVVKLLDFHALNATFQYKQLQQGEWEGVKEGMANSLHTLDPCLALLVVYWMSNSNMSKPVLVVHQGGMQEGIQRVSLM